MKAESFRPLPLLANRHLQTVLAMYIKRGRFPVPTVRHLVHLEGGDQLVLHENAPEQWSAGDPVAVVVHGLSGSHRSGGVVLQALRLFQLGARVFRLDLRGAGAGFTLAKKLYNAGCSDDLRAATRFVMELAPDSPLVMVGTSLGGNVVLKLSGELQAHPIPNLQRVAALNPPVDLAACTTLLSKPHNRVYERHFVTDLIRNVTRLHRHLGEPGLPVHRRMTLKQFDDLYTAPRNGFADADDYYSRASSAPFVSISNVPTLIVTARDDPFVAVEPIERLSLLPHVEVHISNRGGHTGFLGRDGQGGLGWAETGIAGWLCER